MRELEKEIEREVLEMESREKRKKKKERRRYVGIRVWCSKNKRKKKGNIWMKEWKYYHNIFTIFSQ